MDNPKPVMPLVDAADVKIDMGDFQLRLRELKKQTKLSNSALASAMNVSETQFYRWFRGETEPRPSTRKRVEKFITETLEAVKARRIEQKASEPEDVQPLEKKDVPGSDVEVEQPPRDKVRPLTPQDRNWSA